MNRATHFRILEVAQRQAFGVGFEPSIDDETRCLEISQGRVTISPHSTWNFGTEIDWRADPFEQRNWCAQLHMLRWLDPIRRCAASGIPDFIPHWRRHVKSWANDSLKPEQTTKWAWKDMVDAMRSASLLYAAPLIDEPDISWYHDLLQVHGEWLVDDKNLGHSNHALHQHNALLQLGSALGNRSWTSLSIARLQDYFATNYDHEGVNLEGAPGYWELNLRWARETAHRLQREGKASKFVERAIARTAESIAHATRPDGKLEAIGDTVPAKPSPTTGEHIKYIVTKGDEGAPPNKTTAVYSAGYVFGRTGWGETQRENIEETFYSLMFGRADKVHGHRDGGSLTYFTNGRPSLVEAGKYSYTRSLGRTYALGRAGHNIVSITGRAYNKTSVVVLEAHKIDDRADYFRVADGGYSGVRIQREVIFSRVTEALVVIDTITSEDMVEAECRWHIDPAFKIDATRGVVNAHTSNASFSIAFGGALPDTSIVRGSKSPFEGWVSPKWHQLEETNLLKAKKQGRRFRFVTAIQPVAHGASRLESVRVGQSTGFRINGVRTSEILMFENGVPQLVDDANGKDVRRALAPGTPRALNSRLGSADLRHLCLQLATARRALWHEPDEEVGDAIRHLGSASLEGIDLGVAATLADLSKAGCTVHGVQERPAAPGSREGFDYRAPVAGRFGGSLSNPVVAYQGVPHDFDLPSDEMDLIFDVGALALPARFKRGNGGLVVGFSGALNRAVEHVPRFERARTFGQHGSSYIVFGDPTLDLSTSMSLGWYLGARNLDLPPIIGAVVDRVSAALGVSSPVLFGTSGGGFAALQVGSYVPESRVIAVNPQVDIRSYYPRFRDDAFECVFGSDAVLDPTLIPDYRISVLERYAKLNSVPSSVDLVLNDKDGHHVRMHGNPIIEWFSTSAFASRLSVRHVDWGKGHKGPTVASVLELLADASVSRV